MILGSVFDLNKMHTVTQYFYWHVCLFCQHLINKICVVLNLAINMMVRKLYIVTLFPIMQMISIKFKNASS